MRVASFSNQRKTFREQNGVAALRSSTTDQMRTRHFPQHVPSQNRPFKPNRDLRMPPPPG